MQTFAFAGIIKSYVDEVNIWEFDETRGVENGEASLKTGSIEDSGETSFAIMVGGINCFDFKWCVSSEYGCDRLIVCVDGEYCNEISGEMDSFVDCSIWLPDEGSHEIRWTFSKDGSVAAGADCGWIWFDGIEKLVSGETDDNPDPQPCEDAQKCVFTFDAPWHIDRDIYFEDGYPIRSRDVSEGEENWFSVYFIEERTEFKCWVKIKGAGSCLSIEGGGNSSRYYYASDDGTDEWHEVVISLIGSRNKITWRYTAGSGNEESPECCAWIRFKELDGYVVGKKVSSVKIDCGGTGKDLLKETVEADSGISIRTEDKNPWVLEANVGYDSLSSLRSAQNLPENETSSMTLLVSGSGALSFNWKGANYGKFKCLVDGVERYCTQYSEWNEESIYLERDEPHEITIIYHSPDYENQYDDGLWIDNVRWDAPNGWDDPDEKKVPVSATVMAVIDTRQSPRILDTTNFCERLTYDPAWRNAASVVLTVDASEAVKATESGTFEWKSEKEGLFEMKLEFLDSVGAAIGEPLTASFKIALDSLPALGENATAEDVASILGGVADGKLKANIADPEGYANFRAWLESKGIDHKNVTKSLFAWLSYALDTAGLITDGLKEGDLVIDGFGNGAEDGKFELVASVDGISVGDGATDANLRKVFDIEGTSAIMRANGAEDGFSADNVEISVAEPSGGKVKFTVTPKVEGGKTPDRFFFKVKMK